MGIKLKKSMSGQRTIIQVNTKLKIQGGIAHGFSSLREILRKSNTPGQTHKPMP